MNESNLSFFPNLILEAKRKIILIISAQMSKIIILSSPKVNKISSCTCQKRS
jgi:hypothetical protein